MRLRKLSAMIGEFVAELLNRIGGKLDDMGPGKARFSQILSRCFSKALKGEFGQIPWEIYLMLALLLILIALIVFRKKVVAIYDFFDAKLHGTLFEPNRATNERGSSRYDRLSLVRATAIRNIFTSVFAPGKARKY